VRRTLLNLSLIVIGFADHALGNARRALIGMSDKGPSLTITGTSPDHAIDRYW
jgi:hypothetical protein